MFYSDTEQGLMSHLTQKEAG